MIDSCYDKSHPDYHFNGRIGVIVCKRWHVFENFIADMGYMPGDNSYLDRELGSTEFNPLTTSWRLSRERILTYQDKSLNLKEWAELLEIPVGTINSRIKRNLPIHQVLVSGKIFRKDLTNTRIGMLTVKHFYKRNGEIELWIVKCDCGNILTLASKLIMTKKFRSCGCIHSKQVPVVVDKLFYDNKLRSLTYWSKVYTVEVEVIKQRLRSGLTIAQALGQAELPVKLKGVRELSYLTGIAEATIRNRKILNVSPKQLKSTTKLPVGKLFEYNGVTMTLEQWAIECKENVALLRNRLYAGWTLKDTLEIPSNFMDKIK